MLKFYNHVAQHYGNDFRFNNITMEEAAAVRGFDAPESPEVIVDRMETEWRERLKAFEGLTEAERLEKLERLEGFEESERLEILKALEGGTESERIDALEKHLAIDPFDRVKKLEELKALKQQLIEQGL
jgi:DNA-binding helix-hairpin-helix protein with protein kinase domain